MAGISFTWLQSNTRLAIILGKPLGFTPSQARRCYSASSKFDGAAKQGGDAAKKGVDAAKRGADNLKKEACCAADNAGGKADDAANKVKQAAQDAAGKVQHSAEGAWGTVKDTTQKIKETVVGKADASADCAKDGAAKAKRAFNSDK